MLLRELKRKNKTNRSLDIVSKDPDRVNRSYRMDSLAYGEKQGHRKIRNQSKSVSLTRHEGKHISPGKNFQEELAQRTTGRKILTQNPYLRFQAREGLQIHKLEVVR